MNEDVNRHNQELGSDSHDPSRTFLLPATLKKMNCSGLPGKWDSALFTACSSRKTTSVANCTEI